MPVSDMIYHIRPNKSYGSILENWQEDNLFKPCMMSEIKEEERHSPNINETATLAIAGYNTKWLMTLFPGMVIVL